MKRITLKGLIGLTLLGALLAACNLEKNALNSEAIIAQVGTVTATEPATETIPPYTPLASLTPSQTLRPPPTFEAATPTRPASPTPSITPTATVDLSISIPGLRGAETPTPTSTAGCEPRKDWKLRYTVVFNDALAKIAEKYGTTAQEIADGNCLTDINVISVDQELRVPGDVQPSVPKYECVPWQVLTPIDGTLAIEGTGELTFNWIGPRAEHNLIRIIRPDNSKIEFVTDLRQNETIDLINKLPTAGTYTWYVYPLDQNYVQIPCLEGGPWKFTKAISPTFTPTFLPSP
jgi:LysM repeat protein